MLAPRFTQRQGADSLFVIKSVLMQAWWGLRCYRLETLQNVTDLSLQKFDDQR